MGRSTQTIFLFSFMQGLAAGIWGFLSIFLLDIGGSAVDVGVLAMAPGLASTFMQLAWGRISDRLGHSNRMASIGFLFSSILSIPVIMSSQPLQIIVASTVQTLLGSIAGVATVVMLADFLDPRHRASFMGIYNPIGFGGSMLGSLGAGLLIPLIGYRFTFMIYTILNLAIASLLRFWLPGKEAGGTFSFWSLLRMSFTELVGGLRELPDLMRKGGAYIRWVVGISIRGLGIAIFNPVLTVYLVQTLNASEPEIGSLNSLAFGVRMISSWPLGLLADRKGAKGVMLTGIAMAITFPLLCAITSDVTQMFPLYVLNGIFWGCINSAWLAWQMNLMPGHYGTYTGLLNFLNGLEWAIGPLIGGFLGQYTSIQFSAIISSATILAGFLILLRVPQR